uniref:RRM domain-containing protein n=1 Tax=Timema bartmani TaxID=61472 RepID=A0A7R9HW65_9NEOP|nr:unnamed protein product [Timema bartmani]
MFRGIYSQQKPGKVGEYLDFRENKDMSRNLIKSKEKIKEPEPQKHYSEEPELELYVGNLDDTVSEELVCALFSQIGSVKGCKIIRELRCLVVLFLERGEAMLECSQYPSSRPSPYPAHPHVFVYTYSSVLLTDVDIFAKFSTITSRLMIEHLVMKRTIRHKFRKGLSQVWQKPWTIYKNSGIFLKVLPIKLNKNNCLDVSESSSEVAEDSGSNPVDTTNSESSLAHSSNEPRAHATLTGISENIRGRVRMETLAIWAGDHKPLRVYIGEKGKVSKFGRNLNPWENRPSTE